MIIYFKTFEIDVADNFLNVIDAKYEMYGKYLQADGAEYPVNSNIQLCDNFTSFLLFRIKVIKNGVQVNEIDNVVIASAIK